ncbi:MAG: isochorismatase family cysteine hydrolase [archaeon]
MTKALLVIDYQNEWIDKNSDDFAGNLSTQIEKLNKLISYCRKKEIPIIFTQHLELDSDGEFSGKNAEIIPLVDFQPEKDFLITKNKVSSFYKTSLESKLKELKVTELIITGILSNLCVRSAVSDAFDRDFKITVITDSCVSFSQEVQDFTFKDLKETRPEISFKTVEEFI